MMSSVDGTSKFFIPFGNAPLGCNSPAKERRPQEQQHSVRASRKLKVRAAPTRACVAVSLSCERIPLMHGTPVR